MLVAAGFLLAAPVQAGTGPSLQQMVGQLMLVRMHGTTPSKAFLQRIERGQIGGVVLFADNFTNGNPAPLVKTLQQAARAGHQPTLLIAVDQEGGGVKRLPGAPSLGPPQMANATIAKAQGLATARNLRALGINVDLAPVLDVNHGGFIAPRTFGSTPAAVSARGTAFAAGLTLGHVLATAKHFPGLGYATLNTDDTVSTVTASRVELNADWLPYRIAIRQHVPIVMLSTAVYPALDSNVPAATSGKVVALLRKRLGFSGVAVTDALQTPEVERYFSPAKAAVRALQAGADMVLPAGVTGSVADTDMPSTAAYAAVLAAAESRILPTNTVRTSYERVLRLKALSR